MACRVLIVVIFSAMVAVAASEDRRRDGLMDRLHSGMKFAQGLLGSESVALKVAEFVVRAFSPGNTNRQPPHTTPSPSYGDSDRPFQYQQGDQDHEEAEHGSSSPPPPLESVPLSALRQLTRLLGLKPAQLGAVAVNALLFVSQMIATFLAGPTTTTGRRPHRLEEPAAWLLQQQSRPLQQLLATARNGSLAADVQDMVSSQGGDEETSCLRLLACKIAPFVVRMQQAVFGNDAVHDNDSQRKDTGGHTKDTDGQRKDTGGRSKGAAVMYRYLPSRQEMLDTSDSCERMHRECDLNVM